MPGETMSWMMLMRRLLIVELLVCDSGRRLSNLMPVRMLVLAHVTSLRWSSMIRHLRI